MGDGLWVTSLVDCVVCSRRWVAVFLLGVLRLECPDCGYMTPLTEDDDDEPESEPWQR